MATLGTQLSEWRSSNQGHQGLLSKLNIDGNLYDIKDPALEFLASEIETRLSAQENKTIRQESLSKSGNDKKFATSVAQSTDGQITVVYDDIRSEALVDTGVQGQFITSVSQGTDGQISITRGGVVASNIDFTSGTQGLISTDVQAAIDEVINKSMALKGVQTDGVQAETIAGAKAYAEYLVNQLAGQDWTANAKTVKNIIDELGGDNASWSTLVDKLIGMTYTADDGNGGTQSVTASSVADYVEHRISEVNAANAQGIESLDAEVYAGSQGSTNYNASTAGDSYTNDTTSKVAVKITEVDGKISAVNVKTNDIASASALTTLDGAAVKTVNGLTPTAGAVTLKGSDISVSSSDSTKIDTAISNLDSNKANKNAINNTNINNWTATYVSETLTWSNTPTAVYVPSGQTL